ncbi:MAG: DUF1232 domain-containing protein [Cytophagales bacterium]|nr:DUF1232 domain-containing protein [Cytophagales bacterium]
MDRVETNRFFKRAQAKAKEILKSSPRLKNLVDKANDKLSDLNMDTIKSSGFIYRVKIFIRMVKAYAKGEYREIQWQNMVLIVAAILYFITPIDLIPDFIPITGLVDDFTVMVWVYNKIQQEVDKFILWEKEYISE